MSTNLEGTYQRDKSNFVSSAKNFILTLTTRANTTPKKPPLFLIYKASDNPKGVYVSSLYESVSQDTKTSKNEPLTYLFDWQGVKYTMTITDTSAVINQKDIKGGVGKNP